MSVRSFKDLPIKFEERNTFVGDKIKMYEIFNKEITIIKYEISESQFKGGYLRMQIEIDGKKRLLQTGSMNLQHKLKQIPLEYFPFKTTIIQEDKAYKMT